MRKRIEHEMATPPADAVVWVARWQERLTFGQFNAETTEVRAKTWFEARAKAALVLGRPPEQLTLRMASEKAAP